MGRNAESAEKVFVCIVIRTGQTRNVKSDIICVPNVEKHQKMPNKTTAPTAEQEWTVNDMDLKLLFKGSLCVIQLVLLYQVLKNDKYWLCWIQMLIAFVAMSI